MDHTVGPCSLNHNHTYEHASRLTRQTGTVAEQAHSQKSKSTTHKEDVWEKECKKTDRRSEKKCRVTGGVTIWGGGGGGDLKKTDIRSEER